MEPTIGRIVLYKLGEHEGQPAHYPGEAAEKRGNVMPAGQTLPMIIVAPIGVAGHNPYGMVNGQVFADGNYTLWVTSRRRSEPDDEGNPSEPGTWCWPVIKR